MPSTCDAVVYSAVTIASAVAPLILAPDEGQRVNELHLLLLPLIGAMIVSGGMIMLSPSPETRRIVVGRAILSLFFGTLTPQLIGMFHPSLAELALRPIILLMVGGVISALAYALSRPFTRELYARAERIAAREAQRLEDKYSPQPAVEEHTIIIKDSKPHPPPNELSKGI